MKNEQELRAYAKDVALKIKKPFDKIPIKKILFKETVIESKGGLFGLKKTVEKKTQRYSGVEDVSADGWILEHFYENRKEFDIAAADDDSYYFILKNNGDLLVANVTIEYAGGNLVASNIKYSPMTFDQGYSNVPGCYSAFLLDFQKIEWETDRHRHNGTQITRNFPVAGYYDNRVSDWGEGLYKKLVELS